MYYRRRWFAANNTENSIDRPRTNADGIDPKFELIYKPPNNDLLMAATSFCAFSSIGCPSFLGSYAYDSIYDRNSELLEQVSTLHLSAMGTAGVISMIALYVCYKIPLRIYNHQTEYVSFRKNIHWSLVIMNNVICSRYIAILPSVIPMVTRQFRFNKGDIVDKTPSKRARKFFGAILKPGFELVSFYKVKNRRLFLTVKCFQTPMQFFEMFANTEKYARKIKKHKI